MVELKIQNTIIICLCTLLCPISFVDIRTRAQEITLKTTNTGLGGILTWGLNDHGQLQFGDGVVNSTTNLVSPTALTLLPISPATVAKIVATSVAAGGSHTVIATLDGDVYTVGANEHGQLGLGHLFDSPRFTLVETFRQAPGALYNSTTYKVSMGKQQVVSVAAGFDYSGAVTEEGKVFTWGSNSKGQLGHGCGSVTQRGLLDPWDDISNFQRGMDIGANQIPSSGAKSYRYVDTETLLNCKSGGRSSVPRLVESIAGTFVDKIVLGRRHSAALTGQCSADRFADGLCYPTQGTGEFLGLPLLGSVKGDLQSSGSELLLGNAGVERCVCGQLWMWGDNDFGQLGTGDNQARYSPTLVTALSTLGIHITDVALGAYHTVALSTKGNVYAWGYNSNGQVGTWDTTNQALPVRVKKVDPGFLFVSSIAAGAYHTIVVSDRGDVFAFGSNREGQLGTGYPDMESHPIPITLNIPYLRGLKVLCGAYHCLAVSIDLNIYSWGWGKFGQLGQGDFESIYTPTRLLLPKGIPGFPVSFATGYGHSIMVLQTGDLTYCGVNIWGKNVCLTQVRFSPAVTNDEGGLWRIVSVTRGQIIVEGNEALEFQAIGNIRLFRNETDLGIYPYNSVRNMEGYRFAFDSDILAFPISPFMPDSVANTELLV